MKCIAKVNTLALALGPFDADYQSARVPFSHCGALSRIGKNTRVSFVELGTSMPLTLTTRRELGV